MASWKWTSMSPKPFAFRCRLRIASCFAVFIPGSTRKSTFALVAAGRRAGGASDIQRALAPELPLGPPVLRVPPAFDRRPARLQDPPVRLDERAEVGAAALLLALHDELHVARHGLPRREERAEGSDLSDEVPLRVPAPACEQLVPLDHRAEGVRLPLLERVDRLDVVMIDEE